MAATKLPKPPLHLDPHDLRSEIIALVRAAAEHAGSLRFLAQDALIAIEDLSGNAGPDELAARAARLHGCVVHGLSVLAALALLAGKLQGLAWVSAKTEGGERGAHRRPARRQPARR